MNSLFVSYGESVPSNTMRRPRKGAIIGAGQVGMACAYSMLIQSTFDELVLVDVNQVKLEGEVMDLVHGLSFVEPAIVKAGTIADCQGADMVIITAGARQKTGESRLELLGRNVAICKDLISELVRYCPDAIYLVVSNPVDVMTYVTWKLSGLPCNAIIGSGTMLDTARFRYLLAQDLQLDPRSIHAYIIGEHGDSEVPVWSSLNVAGTPLLALDPELGTIHDPEQWYRLFEQAKNASYVEYTSILSLFSHLVAAPLIGERAHTPCPAFCSNSLAFSVGALLVWSEGIALWVGWRNHKEACVGCIVSCTTSSRCVRN